MVFGSNLVNRQPLSTNKFALLTYRRVVDRFETSDDFPLRVFSKPSEPTELKTGTDRKFPTLCD